MATVKLKRGQESKVSSLPKEDGSLIFGYNIASTPATMQFDQNISGTVQRLNLSVANSSTSDYSKNSAALGSSSLQQIIDKINSASGSGNAFTAIDAATNNIVKLTRANGEIVQKTINNVANATSADNANLLNNIDSSRFVYGGNQTAVDMNYTNANSIWKSGFYDLNVTGGASNDLPTTNPWHWLIQAGHRNNSSTYRYGLQITAPNDENGNLYFRTNPSSGAGTWKTILDNYNYTSYVANKNAYNSASISNATIKLGRSDGSTGTTLTVDNVSHATSATIATSANSINPTLSLTGGDGNTSGYRLVATISIAEWGNYRGVFVVKSRHTGGGILTVSVGCNTSPVSQSNGYFEIKYWGPTSSGSIISSDSWQGYISSDGTKGYLFWKYNDYNTCYVTQLSSDFLLSNGNWMTSIPTSYGVRKSLTSINYASDSNALGGSSLSQILDSITSGSVQVDVATRLASSTKSIANNFTIRTGTPTSSWIQYPIFPIYNTTDTDLIAYKGKSLSILHMDGGAQRHDIVALNGANDGLIYATATSAGTTSSRIERILDGGNYSSLITNLNKQVTFANGLKAQKNVQMDGGNFSTGSTVTTGNGETSISNVKISVRDNTLVITTK